MLVVAYKSETVSHAHVFELFKVGITSDESGKCGECPSTSCNDELIEKIHENYLN